MKEIRVVLVELAKKLTAPFAFVALVLIVIALWGQNIPAEFRALIYITVIGVLLVYAFIQLVQIRAAHGPEAKHVSDVEGEETSKETPAPPPEIPPPAPPALDSLSARERYLRTLILECQTMRLAGLDPNAADPNRGGMSLDKLYISLDTQTPREKPDEKKDERPDLEDRKPLSALEALVSSERQRMVLLGLPGTGKSTFVRYLALRMAEAELRRNVDLPEEWKGRPLVPFMLSLGRFAETIPSGCRKGNAELVEDYLVKALKSEDETRDFAPFALQVIEREGALVMFDGLDEVADMRMRPLVVQAVEDFVVKYRNNPASRFLVTCRTFSYQHDVDWRLTGWVNHELALLSREKIDYFVRAWYDELSLIDPSRRDEYARKCEKLLVYLAPGDRRRLSEIAQFPIILTMMAVVHTHFGELPDTRAQVYERCVELLLIRWQVERSVDGKRKKQNILDALDVSQTVLYQAMWEVAYKAHGERKKESENGDDAALVTEDILSGILKVYLQEQRKVDTFLDYCQSSNGLLMLQGTISTPGKPPRKVYAFPHLTFEEYLAARYLADSDPEEYALELIGKSDRWREAIKLLGEHLCFGSPQRPQMSALLDALSGEVEGASPQERARMNWLAGELLILYRAAFPAKPAPADAAIVTQAREVAQSTLLDPRERADCADAVDELKYVPEDLYNFVQIPSSDSPSSIPAFHIARYPVTNAQYARFLKKENFENRDLWRGFPKYSKPDESGQVTLLGDWGDEGWKWLQDALKDVEEGVLYPRYWREPRFGIARRCAPVVGVTWYEANAYCKWLARQDDSREWEVLSAFGIQSSKFIFRLPTELEWEQAAGGVEPENRFAWDKPGQVTPDEKVPLYANIYESGINRTTPVWTYPQGSSPHGVTDMSGNIWEWQTNFNDSSHRWLSLRGGSWDVNRHRARVSSRSGNHPDGPWFSHGFRVLVVFPPSE